jgi:hypothetical protein
MGFGGGAMIGAPLADLLMNYFKTPDSVGVWQTFLAMGGIYFVFMLIGAFGYRLPPANWRPEGWTPPNKAAAMITPHQVHLLDAHKTAQFWLIWAVLCLNVSAGIGVIGMASPMLQEIFGGSLIGHPELSFLQLCHSGRLYGPHIAVQHRRAILLGIAVRLYRAEEHLLHLLPARYRALRGGAMGRPYRQQGAVRRLLLHHPVDVWRRLRHRSRLPR